MLSSLFGMFSSSKNEKKSADKEAKKEFYKAERQNSCCEMDDDDLDGDLNLSDSEDGELKRAQFKS